MEIKICPKCGAKNWPDKESCAMCRTSLAGVPLTSDTAALAPQQVAAQSIAQPGPVIPPASAPQGSYASPSSIGQQFTPHVRPMSAPVEIKRNYAPTIVAVIALMLVGAALLFIRFRREPLPTTSPEPTVEAFLSAKKTRDLDGIKKQLTEESVQFLESAFDTKQARSAGIDKQEVARMFVYDVAPTASDIANGAVSCKETSTSEDKEARTAVVQVTLTKQVPELGPISSTDDFVLKPEHGAWKIDLLETQKRGPAMPMLPSLGGPGK